ncbi:MAG: glycosyltransferase family 9 protein, partial [Candidatus Polarisedimenticolia bacterium]
MTPIRPEEVRRILIRANNWIGDVVMISPAVRAIREHFRDARIAMLAKRWVLDALAGQPHYDDLIEYDDEGAHRGLIGRLRLARRLRARRFDLAILFQKAFDAAFLAA